ncbi:MULTISPECIES: bifunctional DNA primase/polymerase [unclassified Microbacterium]|uniref:bifunctional DNA primase/polymerase n=1 Tax=unclassified Microbacterium TaxID=2609290 RepID=UPI00068EF7A8|nr:MULTISPECIES: bifunctional DNA primase/polymerase [unclassified Microbacterium]
MIPLSELNSYAERGWRIFPCHSIVQGRCSCGNDECDSPGKHPRTHNGVKGASGDVDQIKQWNRIYPDANWALATGIGSGVWVLDVDQKVNLSGAESMRQWTDEHGSIPLTFTVATGGGGWHLYFVATESLRNRTNALPGVDVRADGGYVLLPGSNHLSGSTYSVLDDKPLIHAPRQLLEMATSRGATGGVAWTTPSTWTAGVAEGGRDDYLFRLACDLRRRLDDDREVVTQIVVQAAANCTPPFPEADALRKVQSAFEQDHADLIDVSRVPFSAPEGELYDFLGELDPEMVEAIERAVKAAKVRTFAARVLREERTARYGDSAALDGEAFMFGDVAVDVPIWGEGDDLFWAEGGGLMIPSDQGLGKSLTAQQLIAGRLGIGPGILLGHRVSRLAEGKSIVYLALDRPRQIARSMARLFVTPGERAIAGARLSIWTKPVPIDILGEPYAFADWLEDTFGTNIGDLVIDSVKDLTPANLSNGEVGQALDMAWKECRARGMSTLVLHHERKTGNDESRSNRQPSLDNIYGSVWLTSGMDSILHIQGKQGENVVTYTHLKAIINMLEPITAMHDQEHGRTVVVQLGSGASQSETRVEQVFAVIQRGSAGGGVVSSLDVVQATGLAQPSVNRYVKTLRESGRIEEASPYDRATGTPATYRAAEREEANGRASASTQDS